MRASFGCVSEIRGKSCNLTSRSLHDRTSKQGYGELSISFLFLQFFGEILVINTTKFRGTTGNKGIDFSWWWVTGNERQLHSIRGLNGAVKLGFVVMASYASNMLTVDEDGFWKGVSPVEFGELPALQNAVEMACSLLDRRPKREVISWNGVIRGYAHASHFIKVLVIFEDMQKANMKPDNCTFVNVLSVCTRVGALSQGEWVHANGVNVARFLATALVDMYSKCGCVEKALEVFQNTSKKDISTWNSMIVELSMREMGEHVIWIFSEMLADGFKPNEVTFVSVLSACSCAGLLDEGRQMFDLIVRDHRIQPIMEHYGCMVDLLGWSGLLEEAKELARKIPLKEAPVLWETLLGACRNHGDVELAEHVARKLQELDSRDGAGYVQLSNIRASMTVEEWIQGIGFSARLERKVNIQIKCCADVEEVVSSGFDSKIGRVTLHGDQRGGNADCVDIGIQPKDFSLALPSLELALVSIDSGVVLLRGTKVVSTINRGLAVTACIISPHGSEAMVGAQNDILHIYFVTNDTPKEESTLEKHWEAISIIRYSPDVSMIASGNVNRETVVWDCISREVKIKNMLYHIARISCLAWSPDSNMVAISVWVLS